MERILVPIDFSPESNHAMDLAYQIARKSDAKLILLHVIEHPTNQSFSALGDGLPADMENNLYILQLLKKVKEDLTEITTNSQYSDINIGYDIKIGNPYRSIAQSIADENVDTVIMGSKGSSGLDEVLIGSNAEKVVRHAHCPVITVKQKINITDIGEIVFASEFTETSEVIVAQLKKLQKVFVGKLHLVKINTPNNFQRDKDSKSVINQFVEKYNLENCTVNVFSDLTEEDGIIGFADDINADMIAMTTHGRTGFMHILSGSIAEDVVNHSKRPVWTYNIESK